MRSPEQLSTRALRATRRSFLTNTLGTLAYGAYAASFDTEEAWEKLPSPDTVRQMYDEFGRRIVGTIVDSENGQTSEHRFMGDGFTIVTGGREFRITGAVPERYKPIRTEEILSKLDMQGVRDMLVDDTNVTWYGPNGMITILRSDMMKILGHLKTANTERQPVTVHDISYAAMAELKVQRKIFGLDVDMFIGKVEDAGKSAIEFLQQTPPSYGQLAMNGPRR